MDTRVSIDGNRFFFVKRQKIDLLAFNSLQSNIAIWLLNIFLIFIVIFAITASIVSSNLGFHFNEINETLLPMIVPFSILSIIISKYLSSRIAFPLESLENIIKVFFNEGELDILKYKKTTSNIIEFIALENFICNSIDIYQKNRQIEIEFSKMAAQVAHDIKSPMIALNNYFKDFINNNIKKDVVELSINRINEISNNLLSKHKQLDKLNYGNNLDIEIIFPILEEIIIEKKYQFFNRFYDIILLCDEKEILLSSLINVENFKRLISNLLNNSIESINGSGKVFIKLIKEFSDVIIIIKDTGCGIKAIDKKNIKSNLKLLPNNKNGNRLGVAHAIKCIQEWGGRYKITSKEGLGTTFSIYLPAKNIPNWFLTDMYLFDHMHIVIVAYNCQIFSSWKEKIVLHAQGVEGIVYTHLKSFNDLDYYLTNVEKNSDVILLIDYDFYRYDQNTFNRIRYLPPKRAINLLMNHYPDNSIKEICKKENIKCILQRYVNKLQVHNLYSYPDLILIDDSQIVKKTWMLESKKYNKKIVTFSTKDTFMCYIDLIDKKTHIYVDFHLDDDLGEDLLRNLHHNGFENLFMTTGYDPNEFIIKMPWLKGVIDKQPPFLKL